MLISWWPSWIFWKTQKLLKINQKLIKDTEYVSNLFQLSISMGQLEIKMHFKKFYVKVVKSWFCKSGCNGNGLIGTGLMNILLSSLINFFEKSLHFTTVAVFVAKIRIFEISAGTLCPLPSPPPLPPPV